MLDLEVLKGYENTFEKCGVSIDHKHKVLYSTSWNPGIFNLFWRFKYFTQLDWHISIQAEYYDQAVSLANTVASLLNTKCSPYKIDSPSFLECCAYYNYIFITEDRLTLIHIKIEERNQTVTDINIQIN